MLHLKCGHFHCQHLEGQLGSHSLSWFYWGELGAWYHLQEVAGEQHQLVVPSWVCTGAGWALEFTHLLVDFTIAEIVWFPEGAHSNLGNNKHENIRVGASAQAALTCVVYPWIWLPGTGLEFLPKVSILLMTLRTLNPSICSCFSSSPHLHVFPASYLLMIPLSLHFCHLVPVSSFLQTKLCMFCFLLFSLSTTRPTPTSLEFRSLIA